MSDIDLDAVKSKVQKRDCSLVDSFALSKILSVLLCNEKKCTTVEYVPMYTLNEKCNELAADYGISFVNEDNYELEEKENKVLRTEFSSELIAFYNEFIASEEFIKLLSAERLTSLCPYDPERIGMVKSFLLFKINDKTVLELMKEGREFQDFIPSISGLPLFGKQLKTDTVFNTNIYYTENGDFYLSNTKGDGYNCSESLERIYKVLVGQYDNEGNLSNDSFKYNQKASNISSSKGDIAVLLSNFYTKLLKAIDYDINNIRTENLEEISKYVGVPVEEIGYIFNSSVVLFHYLVKFLAIYGYTPNYTYGYSYFARNKNATPNDFAKQTNVLDGYADRVATAILRNKCGIECKMPDGMYVTDKDRLDYFIKLSTVVMTRGTYLAFNASDIINNYNTILLAIYAGDEAAGEYCLDIPLSERIPFIKEAMRDVTVFDEGLKDLRVPIECIASDISRISYDFALDSAICGSVLKGEFSFLNEIYQPLRDAFEARRTGEGLVLSDSEVEKIAMEVESKKYVALLRHFMKKRMEYPGQLGPRLRFTEEFQKVVAEGVLDVDTQLPKYRSTVYEVLRIHFMLHDAYEPNCGLDANNPILKDVKESWDKNIDALTRRRETYIKLEETMKANNEKMRKEISENIAKFKTLETEATENFAALAEKAEIVLSEEEGLKTIADAVVLENLTDKVPAEVLEIDVETIADEDLAETKKNVETALKAYEAEIKKRNKEFDAAFVKVTEVTKEELKNMKSEIKAEAKKKKKAKEEEKSSSSSSSNGDEEESYFDKLTDVIFSKETAIAAGVATVAFLGYKLLKKGTEEDDDRGEQGEVFLSGKEGFNAIADSISKVTTAETSKVVSAKVSEVASEGIVSKIAGFFTGSMFFNK